jgi:hypothetical protein
MTTVSRPAARRPPRPSPLLIRLLRLPSAVYRAGFGPRAEWYRNVLAGGAEEVTIGRIRFRPSVRVLAAPEAIAVLAACEHRNRLIAPVVRAVLSRVRAAGPHLMSTGAPSGTSR